MPIEIHPTARVSPLADIEDSVRGTRIVIGKDSVVDSFVKIKPVGGTADVIIGERVYLNSGCVIYSGNGVTIGNDVLVAANCVFAPVNHEFKDRNHLIVEQRFSSSRGGIIIEDDVWLGAGCVLLDGAIARRGAVIGALSLVRDEMPAYSINVGNPLRLVGWRK